MRVLVTNDDGVDAPGIGVLAAACDAAGHDVVVAAPIDERSGSGAAIGHFLPGGGIGIEPRRIPGAEHLPAWGVDGPPALAVLAASLGAFGDRPDVIVSGINPGHNTGRSVLHSGTVGAALTGANLGVSGLAVSTGASAQPHWDTAATIALAALDWLASAPVRTVCNLNVPDVPLDAVRGVRWAELAAFGTVRTALVGSGSDRLQLELHETGVALPPDSDTALVTAGYAAVSCLTGIRVDEWQPVAAAVERRLAAGPRIVRVPPAEETG